MSDPSTAAVLTPDSVVLGQSAVDMEEAIEFVGGLLIERGIVEPGYIAGMKQREETVSTYLGNGVALPHGTYETRGEVKGTGIVVAQYPDGVQWGEGVARLVVGLAATGEDHIGVLSALADVLQDEELCERLWTTDDASLVFDTLNAAALDDDEDDEDDEDDYEEAASPAELSVEVTILNPAGLHARPAALVVERAKDLASTVTIATNGKEADAKSILAVLALGGTTGDVAVVTAVGEDAEYALAQITEIMTATEEEL